MAFILIVAPGAALSLLVTQASCTLIGWSANTQIILGTAVFDLT